MNLNRLLAGAAALLLASAAPAETAREAVLGWVEEDLPTASKVAREIWDLAELGYLETRSSALLQQRLAGAGFTIEAGVAKIPTAFVARRKFGKGGPVIGILAEFDALPGLSQTAAPYREERADHDASHACGHHLFGSGSVAAALAVARWLAESGTPGEIRVYGTPAEEGGSGKVYMVRAGLFSDVDGVLHWHPDDRNSAGIIRTLANRSALFRFKGIASHAGGAPERGRSALDGIEAMNYMVNLLREHVQQETRIHYVIVEGGEAPNVVPDSAASYYYVRHPDVAGLEHVWARVVEAAKGAARGTGTEMTLEVMHGNLPLLSNRTLQERLQANFEVVGGVVYDDAERAFARAIHASLVNPRRAIGDQERVDPFTDEYRYGSTDVGDVSWVVPTGWVRAATFVPGTAGHSWQAVAAGGTSIGYRGMAVAAKTLALTAVDLFADPAILAAARAEFVRSRGPDFKYQSLIGDRDPPLDYRIDPSDFKGRRMTRPKVDR
jgi:aminobenzoyl-glutamate utilization protein B